jgi:hypothetical protein
LKQKVSEDRSSKQKKAKNFRGLQPAERPIILPGGRKWKNAKDAMNDELIAEIISSQAELIMGTTLGYVFNFHVLSFSLIHRLLSILITIIIIIVICSSNSHNKYESPVLHFDDR